VYAASIFAESGIFRGVDSHDGFDYFAAVPGSHFFAGIDRSIFHDVIPKMDSLEHIPLAPVSVLPKTDVYAEEDRIILEMETSGLR
jgi:hypothetical protein